MLLPTVVVIHFFYRECRVGLKKRSSHDHGVRYFPVVVFVTRSIEIECNDIDDDDDVMYVVVVIFLFENGHRALSRVMRPTN